VNAAYAKHILGDFADRTSTQIMEYIPRSVTVTQSELQGKTTIEAFPESEQAGIYRQLAQRIYDHNESKIPTPLEIQELREWAASWADQLLALETGEIRSQAANI
jgi:nitrogenase iron protein NifH